MQVWVRFLTGGRRGETVPLMIPPGQSATVGRADDNTIILPPTIDVAASSHHAELRNQNHVLYLIDCGSTNGTWVYGQRITSAPLASGIKVVFGRGGPEAEVFFQPVSAPAPVPQPEPVPVPMRAGVRSTAPLAAAAQPASAVAAPPALPRPGDPCGICRAPLGADLFMCYGCRLGLCAAHYDPNAGVCMVCSGAMAAPPSGGQVTRPVQSAAAQDYGGNQPARPAAPQGYGGTQPARLAALQQQTAPAVASPAGAGRGAVAPPPAGYGTPAAHPHAHSVEEGCEICGALEATSFVCYGCTRCVCETHRDRATGMCEQCAGAKSGREGGIPAQGGYQAQGGY